VAISGTKVNACAVALISRQSRWQDVDRGPVVQKGKHCGSQPRHRQLQNAVVRPVLERRFHSSTRA